MGLKINVGRSKVLVDKKEQRGNCAKVRVSEKEMPEADKYNCLGVMIYTDGRVLEGRMV